MPTIGIEIEQHFPAPRRIRREGTSRVAGSSAAFGFENAPAGCRSRTGLGPGVTPAPAAGMPASPPIVLAVCRPDSTNPHFGVSFRVQKGMGEQVGQKLSAEGGDDLNDE